MLCMSILCSGRHNGLGPGQHAIWPSLGTADTSCNQHLPGVDSGEGQVAQIGASASWQADARHGRTCAAGVRVYGAVSTAVASNAQTIRRRAAAETEPQEDLFRARPENLMDLRHALVRLAGPIEWGRFETAFGRSVLSDVVGASLSLSVDRMPPSGSSTEHCLAAFAWTHCMPRCCMPARCSATALCGIARRAFGVAAVALLAMLPRTAAGQGSPLPIAVVLTLSGPAGNIGTEVLEGVRMAIEEAGPRAPRVDLAITDDQGSIEGARNAARRIADGNSLAVIGPSLSALALAVDPIYAEAGLAVIAPTIATDEAAGIFRLNLGQSKVGEALSDYLRHALGGRRAQVIYSDDGYGQPLALGFRRGAGRLGITATYHPVSSTEQAEAAARRVAGDPGRPAIILGMLETSAVPVLRILKRADVSGPVLATTSFAYRDYARLFSAEPEERATPGFFTDAVYAASPVLFDSGNAALLAFEERFRARHGHEPSWRVVLAYDAVHMLLRVLASVAPPVDTSSPDIGSRRRAIREAMLALNSPVRAFPGLSGLVWFDAAHGRPATAIRIARFDRDWLESAPVQLVPVVNPDLAERLTGAVVPIADGRFARFQQVVYTGIYLNEIARLDLPQSSFTADFYLWLRSAAAAARPGDVDPAEIQFPDMRRGRLRSGTASGPPGTTERRHLPPLAPARRIPQRVRSPSLSLRQTDPGSAVVQCARRLRPDHLRTRPTYIGRALRPSCLLLPRCPHGLCATAAVGLAPS